MSNIINMITNGSKGLTPTIRAYAPEGSTLTCDGKSYTLKTGETYHDFTVSCEKVSVLPTGYTGLEYIESSGSQWIDTGIIADLSTEMDIDFQYTANSPNQATVAGSACSNSGWRVFFVHLRTDGEGLMAFDGSDNNYVTLSTTSSDFLTRHQVSLYGDGQVIYDGTTLSTGGALSGNNLNVYLFSRPQTSSSVSTYASTAKVYSFSMYKNSVQKLNYIPCTNASSEVGMYDTVSETFFGNSGTGSFTASTNTKEYAEYPTYTVTATLDGVTATSEVTVDKVGLFETEMEFYTIPTDGLYAEYLFDDGTFADTSGNSRAGSVGGATFVENDTGYALQKNTSTSSPTINSLPTGACSISCWIKYPSTISDNHVLFYIFKSQNASFFEAVMSDGYLYTHQSTDSTKIESVTAGAIRHLVVTYDSSFNGKIYINGVDTSLSFTGQYSGSATGNYILGSNTNSIKWGDGWIDCIRVYSRELTADDVKNLYANGKMR